MDKIMILYQTTLGETRKVSDKIKELIQFYKENVIVDSCDIDSYDDYLSLKNYDLIIFGFPIFNSQVPRVFQNCIGRLMISAEKQPCAIFATYEMFPGECISIAEAKLKTKNYYCVEYAHFRTFSHLKFSKSPLVKLFNHYNSKNIKQIDMFVRNILRQLSEKIYTYSKPKLGYDAFISTALNKLNLLRMKKVYLDINRCNKCGICCDVCPQKCYFLGHDGFPQRVSDDCENCYKCITSCPKNAISLSKGVSSREL